MIPATAPRNVRGDPLPPDLLPSWLTLLTPNLVSPRYVSAALMPNGHVGLVFASGDNGVNTAAEVRFLRYTDEHATAGSMQLSTAGPA